MEKKQYTVATHTRSARPRSRRLREAGGSNVTVNHAMADGGAAVDTHTHANKAALDTISIDTDNYLHLTQFGQATATTKTEKVKAGYADEATHAAKADHAAFADEATHAVKADHAAFADEATHALDADHATFADNADRWDGSEFSDYVDQPVRTTDEVRFKKVIASSFQTPDFAGGTAGVGARIDQQGVAEMESLRLRRFLEVPELHYNRVEVTVGDRWSSPSAGVLLSVDPEQCIATLRLQEGEVGSIAAGDLCMGIFHSEIADDNATEDYDDSRGNRRFAGFVTVYFRIEEVMGTHRDSFRYSLRPASPTYAVPRHPLAAMTFVGYGSDTNPARRSSRYDTRTYQRYLRGVDAWELRAENIAAQLGDLSNLSLFGMQMTGYSAYLDNIYMQGILRSTDGMFNIDTRTKTLLIASSKSGQGLAFNPEKGLTIGKVFDPVTGRFAEEYDLGAISQTASDAASTADEAQNTASKAEEDAAAANKIASEAARKAKEAKDFLDNVLPSEIAEINRRLDGVVENWYSPYVPSAANAPASVWTTDALKEAHVGDTFTSTQPFVDNATTPDAGKSWRWVNEGGYHWTPIADSDAVKALLLAAKAQADANGKSRTFVTTPTPPYAVGDWWAQGGNGELMRCIKAREAGAYDPADWDKASKYTDDTVVNNLMQRLADDSVISKEEKATLRNRLAQIERQYTAYAADAQTYGVSISALAATKEALASFLTGTVAVAANTDTALTEAQRTVYNSLFSDYDVAVSRFTQLVADKVAQGKVDDIQVSGVNLVAGGKEVIVLDTGGSYSYTPLALDEPIQGGDQVTVHIGKSEMLAGEPSSYSVILYKNDYTGVIVANNSMPFGENVAWTATIPDGTPRQDILLLFYSGIAGHTAGKSMKFTNITLTRGNRPMLSWAPSVSETKAEIIAAQTAAANAKAAADAATAKLTDWASDRSISPMEKTALKQQQSDMQSEYAEVIASAGKYAVGTQSYTNAYTTAIAALAKYTATTPESIPIEADYANIAAYYPARQTILEQISAASKSYSEKLVDEVQVGGVNLLKGTAAFNVGDIAPNYAGWGSSQVETFRGNVVKAIGTAWNGFRLPNFIEDKVPYDCMLSFYARVDSGVTDFISITQRGLSVRVKSTQWKQYSVFLPAGIIVNNALRQGIMETTSSNKVYISSIKLEKGNKPTDWSPAPEDVDQKIDDIQIGGVNLLANSSAEKTNPNLEFLYYANINDLIDKYGTSEYTISFDIKATKPGNGNVYFTPGEESTFKYLMTPNTKDITVTTEYTRHYITFTPRLNNAASMETPLAFYFNYGSGVIPTVKNVKIETGNKATGWSPAPEDVQAEISYGKIYLRGTGLNRDAAPIILVNGVSILPSYGRGMMLAVLKRLTMETVKVETYDIFGTIDAQNALAAQMAQCDDRNIVILVSYDAISITTPELKAQIARCGGTQVNFVELRMPYALIGIPDIGEGNGLETYTTVHPYAPHAQISVQVINGIPQGIAPPAARIAADAKAAADAANAQLADIASDSKLTPSEKVETQNRWEEIYAEYPSYVAQAQQLGIDLASYTAAKEALSAYLAPLLADRSVTSEVNYNTFTTAFKAYYNARAALLQTINDEASGGRRQCTIDATALDQNKYYPVIASLYPNARARIRIFTWLGASGIPTWASHSIGFSCSTTWTSISSGWGVMSVRRYVEESFYGWTKDDIIPVGSIGQVIERSLEYIYVRGGGLYHIDSTHTLSATLYPEGWTDGTFSIPIRDSVAAPVVDVDQVKQGLSDVDYLKKAFANGSTEVAGGVVLSEFIGIKDGDKVVAGMTNGQVTNNGVASPVPLIFAGAQNVLSAAQTALYALDKNGVQRSRDINGNTITIYNGGISFESMTGGVLKKTLSMAPRTFPPSSSNPVTAFADPELIGANAGSFNVQIPQTNVDAEGRQNIPLVVHTGGMVPFAQTTLWNKTFPLGATFTIGGDATVKVPAMTISALVDIGFSNWMTTNVDMPEHDAYIFLHNEDVGTDIHVDLSMGDGWSVTTREIISTGIPNGRYTLMCRSEGKAVLPFVKFPATAHCSASIHIADTTFSVSWSSTKAVSKIFGNGCTFASRTNQYCGIIGSDTEYIFEHRSGDVGFRADAQGSKVWCPARNEWIPADRVLYKGYVSANGQLRRKWAYKGDKPVVSKYSTGVYKVNIQNSTLKAREDYLVRCTGIGTSGATDNRYASPYYISNSIFHVTTVNGTIIMDGDFFFEVVDISDMK